MWLKAIHGWAIRRFFPKKKICGVGGKLKLLYLR